MPDSSKRGRRRRWESVEDNDPLAGLVNLFDLWMVFSIALLIVFVGSTKAQRESARAAKATEDVALDQEKAKPIDRYRLSHDELSGQGEKLGIAYRLSSGEIVCVPETPAVSPK